jgi:hypothetical protein
VKPYTLAEMKLAALISESFSQIQGAVPPTAMNVKWRVFAIAAGTCLLFAFTASLGHAVDTNVNTTARSSKNPKRLRVIVTSDFPPFPVTNSDPDDVQSMVRFLLYANEFDVEGLVASAGTFGMVAEKKNILEA